MSTPTVAPAGWYPNPDMPGNQRYWDGLAWTEHTAPTGGGAVADTTAEQPATAKPVWKRWWFIAAAVLVILFVVGAIAGAGSKKPALTNPQPSPSVASTPTPSDTPTPTPTATTPTPTPTATTQAPKPKPAPPPPTLSQENALGAAQDYLDYQAFSRLGLIDQLSSAYGSGFSKADATWAVNHLTVNWNEQAVKAGQSYLEFQHFSCTGLINQLSSRYGSQFTKAQATYAAKKLRLC